LAGANKSRSRPLEEEEIKALATVMASSEEYRDLYDFFRIAFGTASRLEEILSLQWEDVDFEERTIKLYAWKPQKDKFLSLQSVVSIIEKGKQEGLGNNQFVFASRDHKLRRLMKKAATAANIKYGSKNKNGFVLHDLRGTALSNLLGAGVDLSVVSKVFANHHSIKQRTIYLNPTKKRTEHGSEVADSLVDLATAE
jgi:integrase